MPRFLIIKHLNLEKMKKSILNLEGVKKLSKEQQMKINGGGNGNAGGGALCCFSDDFPPEIDGCYDYFLCE
ncbi:MAG: hypothetical protein CMP76_09405 [Flavobacterium sp.]|nr:hypothetical protein [Flavobacterium sp.]